MTALSLNQIVTGSRTIRDMTAIVSTNSYLHSKEEYIGNEELSLESWISNQTDKIDDAFDKYHPFKEPIDPTNPNSNTKYDPNKAGVRDSASKSNMVEPPKNVSLPSGRIIELFFNNPNANGKEYSLKVFMKLNPRFISNALVEYVVDANFRLPFTRRLLQLQAGEIKFFRDFIFQMDSVEKRAKALKNDKDGALMSLFGHQAKSYFKRILKTLTLNQSMNIFNSILILEESNFMRITHNKGLNFKDPAQRQRFFEATASLFIVLVDPQYSMIKMYTNGIEQEGEYTYNAFKSATSGDKMNVADIMQMMEQSKLPKF